MIEYDEIISLLLTSIEIVGIIIAIVVGMLGTKILAQKEDKSNIEDKLSDLDEEISIKKKELKNKMDENIYYCENSIIEDMVYCFLVGDKYNPSEYNYDYFDKAVHEKFSKKVTSELIEISKYSHNNPDSDYSKSKTDLNVKDSTLKDRVLFEYYRQK